MGKGEGVAVKKLFLCVVSVAWPACLSAMYSVLEDLKAALHWSRDSACKADDFIVNAQQHAIRMSVKLSTHVWQFTKGGGMNATLGVEALPSAPYEVESCCTVHSPLYDPMAGPSWYSHFID